MTMTDLPTWTEEYRTADRSNWRTGGAWEDEPVDFAVPAGWSA